MHLTAIDATTFARYDVVIVGTSFAALPIAETLAPRARVLLIDGGDVVEREESHALTVNDEYGHFSDAYWSTHWVRVVGGTSTRWSGVVAALEADDFTGGRGRPAWPVTRAALDEPYARAATWLGRPAAIRAPGVAFGDRLVSSPLSHDDPIRLNPIVIGRTKGEGIDLLTRHTVVRPTSADRRRVDGLVVTDASRTTTVLPVAPRQVVVLACGGLGNAQILLQPPDAGDVPIGNESGLAGRFLMEHPHVISGDLLVHREALPPLPEGFGPGLQAFRLAEPIMREHDLLAASLAVQGPIAPPPEGQAIEQHFRDAFQAPVQWAQLYARTEQEPSPTNRVEILAEKNWAGSHRLRTHCSFSSRDLRTIEVSTRVLGEALRSMGMGAVRLRNKAIYRETSGGGHTMGTTRMGDDPAASVCDATQRVHEYENLYVSGSSVFPTSGAVNPTLTIVALAFRLADHLAARIATRGGA